MNDSYEDAHFADTEEFVCYVKLEDKIDERSEDILSSQMNPKFVAAERVDSVEAGDQAPPSPMSSVSTHQRLPDIDQTPADSCFDPPTEQRESLEFTKGGVQEARKDSSGQVLKKGSSLSKFSYLRTLTQDNFPLHTEKPSPMNGLPPTEPDHTEIPTQPIARNLPHLQLISSNYYFSEQESSLHTHEYQPQMEEHGPNQFATESSPRHRGSLAKPKISSNSRFDTRRSNSVVSKNIKPLGSRFQGFSDKEIVRVFEQILKDADSHRWSLLSEEDLAFLKNYKESKGKQRTLAERLDKQVRRKEMQQNILNQIDEIKKFKDCTFTPTLTTAKNKQMPDRSFQEFLLHQQQHQIKKENRLNQKRRERNLSESEAHSHHPKTLARSNLLAKKRGEQSPHERLYQVSTGQLRKQINEMLDHFSSDEDESILSNPQRKKLAKVRSEDTLHKPQINKRSKQMKRSKPIGEHLYSYRKKDTGAQPKLEVSTFMNTKSYKLLYSKFKTEFRLALEQVLSQYDQDKNAMDDETRFVSRESVFSKDVLVLLLARMGYLQLTEKERELSFRELRVIGKIEELAANKREHGGINAVEVFQLLAAISGFVDLFLYDRPNVAFPPMADPEPAIDLNGGGGNDRGSESMTLHFFEDLKMEREDMEIGGSPGGAGGITEKNSPFLNRANIIEEKLESSEDLTKDSIFTEDGKLQLCDASAKLFFGIFGALQKQRKEFELERKLGDNKRPSVLDTPHQTAPDESFRPSISPTSAKIVQSKIKKMRSYEGDRSKQLDNSPECFSDSTAIKIIEDKQRGADDGSKRKGVGAGKKLFTSQLHSTIKAKLNRQKLKEDEEAKFQRECTFKPKRVTGRKGEGGDQDPALRLYNRFKKGQKLQEQRVRQRKEELNKKEEEECTFQPKIMKSTSMTDFKNPYWTKNVEKSVLRLQKAREEREMVQRAFKRGIPGSQKDEQKLNFSLEKKFKPTFDDLKRSPRGNTNGKGGKAAEISVKSARGTGGGFKNKEAEMKRVIDQQQEKAQVAAVNLQREEEI